MNLLKKNGSRREDFIGSATTRLGDRGPRVEAPEEFGGVLRLREAR